MNPARFIHLATVQRVNTAIASGDRTKATATVVTDMPCLVEGLPARARASILGTIPSARYTFTWGTTALQVNDRVTWNGKVYFLKEILDDTTRPTGRYQTGILAEKQ